MIAPRALAVLAPLALALLSSCARPAPVAPASAAPAEAKPAIDPCKGAPPLTPARPGILRAARCEAEIQLVMTSISEQLGVPCRHCHAPLAVDPTKLDYVAATRQKAIANWMSVHLSAAVKPADGSRIECRSCHADNLGRPTLKVLGAPRDREKANEHMSLVMVRRFVAADGARLKCRSCHGGTPGTPAFRAEVIGHDEALPAHGAAPPARP